VEHDGKLFARPVPAPKKPKGDEAWTVANLVYLAGLPVPADLALVKPDADDPDIPDYSDLSAKLTAILDPSVPKILLPDVLGDWLKLARRTFVDEVDNFPSVAVGDPPCAEFDDAALVAFHPLRVAAIADGGDTGERHEFFSQLQGASRSGIVTTLDTHGSDSNRLGNLWGRDRAYFIFDNRRLIVTVANLAVGGARFGRSEYNDDSGVLTRPAADLLATDASLHGLRVTRDPARNALLQAPPPLAELKIDSETWDVIAHELGHAFGLGDEYSGNPSTFQGRPSAFDDEPNLMAYSAAIKDDQSTPDPRIVVDRLKWTWPRARKASVLTRPIEEMFDGEGSFRVFVGKGRGSQFLPGDAVRFRVRNPRESLPPNPKTSVVEFVVVATHPENLSEPGDPTSMTVVVKNEAIGIDIAPFAAGSVIYVPVAAPHPTQLRPYLTLVPPVSERIMETIGGTMSGVACAVDDSAHKAKVQVPNLPLDQLLALAPAHQLPDLVGAYFGGSLHACGVLHPAGSCIMRSGRNDWARFCPVCQYALAEKIDPEQHWRIDRAIAPLYEL
jgi:hypothetical protein